ncbi:hypothetical protein MBAV_005775 [Candidatus Magnetobacterium bavaricum]|uniref:Uncharacterized protein n=1 Tax=Candidatus Magnetobacterium bavaricum TaxID=29290 RepID=A0A0F3GJ96_9BACT|nr:hypothetical protein MBAV_005775 [Candidatus Magnetobacterium bavaricum]
MPSLSTLNPIPCMETEGLRHNLPCRGASCATASSNSPNVRQTRYSGMCTMAGSRRA